MGVKRSQLLRVYERALEGTTRNARDNVAGQLSLFDDMDASAEMELPDIPELDKQTLLKMEKNSIGMYFSGHPMEEYTEKAKRLTKHTIRDILDSVQRDDEGNYHAAQGALKDGDAVIICAAIASRKNKTTRANAQMAFIGLEDAYGSIECIVFPKVLTEYSAKLQENNIVAVRGRVSIREDEEPKLIAETVEYIDEAIAMSKLNAPKKLYIKLPSRTEETLKEVQENLAPYQGDMQVCLFFEDTKKMAMAPRRLWFNNTPSALLELQKVFGEENVRVK